MSLIFQSLPSIFYHAKQSLVLFILFFFTILLSVSILIFNQLSHDSFENFKRMLLNINVDSKSNSNLVVILTKIHENQLNHIYLVIAGLLLLIPLISLIIYKKIIKKRKSEHAGLAHIGESSKKIALSFAFEIFMIFTSALCLAVVLIFLFKNSYALLLKTINIYWLKHSLSSQLSPATISAELLKLMSNKITNFNGNFLISATNIPPSPLISQELFVNSTYLFIGGFATSILSFLSVLFSNRHNPFMK